MENDFIKAREIVLKKVSEENPNYSLFVCGLYGIIRKFSKYIDISIIEKIFLDCDIYFFEGKLGDALQDSGIGGMDEYYDSDSLGVSHPYYSYYYNFVSKTFVSYEEIPFIFIKDGNNNEKINIFIHEFLHLLKSYNNPFEIDNDIMAERHGLNIHTMVFDGKEILNERNGLCLDEVFNVIDTSKCLEEVKALNDFCPDSNVINFLSTLNKETLSDYVGYLFEVLLLEKLYENDYFRNKYYNSVFSGNIDSFADDFNNIYGAKIYSEFNKLLDLILEAIDNSIDENLLFDPCNSVMNIIDSYLEKVKCKVKVNY